MLKAYGIKGIPFDRVALRKDGTFEYFLTQDLVLLFDGLTARQDGEPLDTDLIEVIVKTKLFENAQSILRTKMTLFEEHEEDRLKRFFSNQSKSLFFDSDHIAALNNLFESAIFDVDVSILYKGEFTTFIKLRPIDQEKVMAAMRTLNIVVELTYDEFRGYGDVRKVKAFTKRSKFRKGGIIMSRKKLIGRVVSGSFLLAVGGAVALFGATIVKNAAETLLGISSDVILVEDDTTREASE